MVIHPFVLLGEVLVFFLLYPSHVNNWRERANIPSMVLRPSFALVSRGVSLVALASVMVGCQSQPPVKTPPAAPLQLIQSSSLSLPDACQASGSFIVAYTVREDGQTTSIDLPPAPHCLQQALTAWVASFRYSPQSSPVPTTIEWLLVEAKQGS